MCMGLTSACTSYGRACRIQCMLSRGSGLLLGHHFDEEKGKHHAPAVLSRLLMDEVGTHQARTGSVDVWGGEGRRREWLPVLKANMRPVPQLVPTLRHCRHAC